MNVRTLKRRLQGYGLGRRNKVIDEDKIRDIIKKEMKGPGTF